MKISFCTTCMGRLHHLKETIFANIEANADHPDIEFVVLNYNSPDGLHEWVKENIGRLKNVAYFREISVTRWRMPHAKNMAHLLATGDVVCNLDADNFTGKGYASLLAKKFTENPNLIVTHVHGGGFGGRIAVRKSDFKRLRGYDEQLSWGWGWEDDDLKARAQKLGLRLEKIQLPDDNLIPHPDAERIKFMPEWKNLREAHSRQSEIFLKRPQHDKINRGGYGKGVVFRGFETTPLLLSDTLTGG